MQYSFARKTYVIMRENLKRGKAMFKKITKMDKRTKLEKEIDCIVDIMSMYPPESREYGIIAGNLETLKKANAYDRGRHVSPDTLAVVFGNLIGIGCILNFEKVNIITSKAMGFVLKGRV